MPRAVKPVFGSCVDWGKFAHFLYFLTWPLFWEVDKNLWVRQIILHVYVMISGGNQLSMAILAFLETRNCRRPSSEIVFRRPLALELPESRASADLRCMQWGRHRPVLCTFFLAHGLLLFSSETSVVSVKREQAELILPVCPTV